MQEHEEHRLVQAAPLQDVRYLSSHSECPEDMFGVESAMTFEGIKDPYARACMVEYMHFMRLTDSLAVTPKFYVFN